MRNIENNLLLNKIYIIQQDYLTILKKYADVIDTTNIIYAINELENFWNSKRHIIEFFLNNYSNNFDTCVLACSSYLNLAQNNHYAFLSLGKKHIIDDSVINFSVSLTQANELSATFIDVIKKCINDNIQIIENTSFDIIILPLTFLFSDKEAVQNAADGIFLSIFNKSLTSVEDFFREFNSFDEIEKDLKDYVKEQLFLAYDTFDKSFSQRYKDYLYYSKCNTLNCSEVQKFFLTTTSMFAHVLDMFLICMKFSFYPLIREVNILNNMCLILPNFYSVPGIYIFANRTIGHSILYRILELSKIEFPDIVEFLENLNSQKFSEKVFNYLDMLKKPFEESGSFKKIQDFITFQMDEINFFLFKEVKNK